MPRIAVELSAIDKALSKTTAALFNLVIHVQDVEHALEVSRTTRKLLSKFPARAIFLTEDPDAKEDLLTTEISSETVGSVCYDQIHIHFGGKQREKVPFIVLPHLLPDLPLYLLWTGDPAPDDVIFPTLEQHTSRIILDADTLDHLPEYSRFVLMLMRSSRSSVADLNWASIDGWRQTILEATSTDEHIEELGDIKSVQITYSVGAAPSSEDPRLSAAYLQGWLAAQLHWKPDGVSVSEGHTRITYTHMGKPVTVLLTPIPDETLQSGIVDSVSIETNGHHLIHLIAKDIEPKVSVHCENPEKCDLPYTLPLASPSKEAALVREVFQKETSKHYENTLELLAQIKW